MAAVTDLEYFRNELVRMHRDGQLADDEIVDLMGLVNTVGVHFWHDRFVGISLEL